MKTIEPVRRVAVLLLLFLIQACNPEVVRVYEEPEGANCQYGGSRVVIGKDKNNDGVVEGDDEVKQISYICSEKISGFNSVFSVDEEPSGPNCEQGGFKISVGIDYNGNSILDEEEATFTGYLCNGRSRLMDVEILTPGSECATGGIKVKGGFDVNANHVLDDEEVDSTSVVCNGEQSLINVKSEEPGENCKSGGIKLEMGFDDNGNYNLDAEEVTSIQYVCNGNQSLSKITDILPGDDCPSGGILVEMGFDTNPVNNILDAQEVSSSQYICNGSQSLSRMTEVPAGENCKTGGSLLEMGFDTNPMNNVLDDAEVANAQYICNGEQSLINIKDAPTSSCPAGGIEVEIGFDNNPFNFKLDSAEVNSFKYVCNGEDGYDTLVKLTKVLPDPEGECHFGGTKVDRGLDSNRSGVLDSGEIVDTYYVCSVQVNENMTLVRHDATYPEDGVCTYGGVITLVGIDDNDNGKLDDPEVDSEVANCNELMIVDGKTTLAKTSPATSTQCKFGGFIFRSGLDDNRDGSLSSAEVDETEIVCNGINGLNTESRVESYSGSMCPENGGQKYMTGLDRDRDGYLDTSEIEKTFYICNGSDGINTLVKTSPAGVGCPADGIKVQSGLDANDNGILDSNEVDSTSYVCDGIDGEDGFDGVSALIETSSAGSSCGDAGGYKIESGLDWDYDGVLDFDEIEDTSYLCNGADGFDGVNSLIETSDAGVACGDFGGLKVETGLDWDYDGRLDSDEIDSTNYVCNGIDGYDTLIEVTEDYFSECGDEWGAYFEVGLDFDRDGILDSDEITYDALLCEISS